MILGAVSGHANVSKPVPHPREQTHLVQLYFDGSLSKAISLASWSSTRARLHAADGAIRSPLRLAQQASASAGMSPPSGGVLATDAERLYKCQVCCPVSNPSSPTN